MNTIKFNQSNKILIFKKLRIMNKNLIINYIDLLKNKKAALLLKLKKKIKYFCKVKILKSRFLK
jgi:hypothetical protein